MAASTASCAHCGKEGVGFKRCSVCKEAWYCGAACQQANWKRHKKTCAPPVPLRVVDDNVNAAKAAGDWRGVLKWEGRMEEMMAEALSDTDRAAILRQFSIAHSEGYNSTGSKVHALCEVGLEERRIPLLGNLQRFRDQGDAMCDIACCNLLVLSETSEAGRWFHRARDVGAAHGFFSVESTACTGLGAVALNEGRHEEGVALMRNALAAAQLNELDEPMYELEALFPLVDALLETHAIEEAEPLVLRFREAAKAQSEKEGGFCSAELRSLLASARLHEARGRPQAAAGEVRALLDVMRENETAVQNAVAACENYLKQACSCLKVLDLEVGEEELIMEVAVELAKMRSGPGVA